MSRVMTFLTGKVPVVYKRTELLHTLHFWLQHTAELARNQFKLLSTLTAQEWTTLTWWTLPFLALHLSSFTLEWRQPAVLPARCLDCLEGMEYQGRHAIMKSYLSIVAPGVNGSDGIAGPQGMQGPPGPTGPPGSSNTSSGTTYVRWGRTVCPNITGTELVYDGLTAGTYFSTQGGGAEYVCAAKGADAEYHPEATTRNLNHARLYSAEYESTSG